MTRVQWSRSIPVRYEADVAVIGGGIAGVSAACAAAKSGAKVILVERFAITGGNATTGGVAAFCGETSGQGEVFDAIVSDLEKWKAIAPYKPYSDQQRGARVFDHHILAIVLQELLIRRGIKLLLHTRFVDVCQESGRISECIVYGKSGPEALRADVFIDCTGEAEVAYALGLETMRGRPEDGCQLPMSMMGFVREVENVETQVPEGWFEEIRDKGDLPMVSVWPNGPGGKALKIKIPMFDSTDTEDMTNAENHARRRMMQVLDYYQRKEKKSWHFDGCSPRIGIREGRRIVGEYVLTVDDCRAGRKFDDAIAVGRFYLDAHKPDDDRRTYILSESERYVPPYQIPFRSLIPKGSMNLLAAGRCFSADQLALSSARVMTTGSMLGQAAGIAAAMCAEANCEPTELDFQSIRNTVESRGAKLEI